MHNRLHPAFYGSSVPGFQIRSTNQRPAACAWRCVTRANAFAPAEEGWGNGEGFGAVGCGWDGENADGLALSGW
jgi:hypothetical protein